MTSIREYMDILFRFSKVDSVINVSGDVFDKLTEELNQMQHFSVNGPVVEANCLPIVLNYSRCKVEVRGPEYMRR